MQIIDLGNSGIRFAQSGAIDLGGMGSGIQIIGPSGIASKYTLKMSGIKDLVSKNSQTDTSAGAAYYIHPDTGELVTVAAGEPLIHPTLGNVSLPAYEQLCQWSEDPGEWAISNAAYADTGETDGPFTEGTITNGAASWHTARPWESIVSGSPDGVLYFNIRYRPGSSGKIYIDFGDAGIADDTFYRGVIGAAQIVDQGVVGTLTIISDEYNHNLGYYELKCSMLFTNLSNAILVGIGSYEANKSIKILGADVSEDRAILDFHVPSSGSNVSIASRAGTTKLAGLADNFPKFYDALDGIDGATAAARISGVWTPGVDYGAMINNQNILSVSGTRFLYQDDAGNFKLNDSTTFIFNNINYTADTPYPFEIVYGPNTALAADKMQLNIQVAGVWQTAIADFDGSFDPTNDLIFGLSNPYQSSIKNLVCEKLSQSHWRS